jgi:hypothetical protein
VVSGQIDLGLKRGGPTGSAAPTVRVTVVPEEPRPAVLRPGKLPAGLPEWFLKLDTDGDGQVGLYEWRVSGRPLQEFVAMDLNGDGFITCEELLRYLARQSPASPAGVARAGGAAGDR